MIVLDASVALKWFLTEEDEDIAVQIKTNFIEGREEIAVPELLLSEISNVLRYKPSFNKKAVKDAVSTILDMGVTIFTPNLWLYEQAISIAYDYNLTVYDALYAALASELECPLITADESLKDALPARFKVKLLRDVGNET